MIYPDALKIAQKYYKQLSPFCYATDIAGSVRREAKECKDIELMCCPRMLQVKDLFQQVTGSQRLPEFIKEVKGMGKIISGDPGTGRHVKIDVPEGIRIDLFIPVKNDYYRQLSIRTGSASYSHLVLATAWTKLGWCGTKNAGLKLMSESYYKMVKDSKGEPKKEWYCDLEKPTQPPVWQNELDFFNWLGLSWIEPSKRYVK